MLTEITIPLTEEQSALIGNIAETANTTIETVAKKAVSLALNGLSSNFDPVSPLPKSVLEFYSPEDRWQEVQAKLIADGWTWNGAGEPNPV